MPTQRRVFPIKRMQLAVWGGFVLVLLLGPPAADAQQAAATGTATGTVTDARGAPVAQAEVRVVGGRAAATTRVNGEYVLPNLPPGTHQLQVSMLGFRTATATITISANQSAQQNFQLDVDPLQLEAMVVTGTHVPRTKQEASVAVTTLSAGELARASPRSTTEVLRYVPGFTRVESSGGEVNQNISIRGIMGVEYVMFMEDGLPVFPTMHTFFMNADNLFRADENIDRIEVVRGGTSALFGSNTPGAIVNFVSKIGRSETNGTMKATAATGGLARYDLNLNGPLGTDWRYNVGGFYRFDNGVRDPGYPGIRGGQLKANLTRLFDNGYVRGSLKFIDDRNQFILPLPFQNPEDPEYVPGFSNFGAMNTAEGNHLRVPTPTGELELPLDDGLRTKAFWLTGDASFELPNGWKLQNIAQVMDNDQGWNAILPFDIMPAATWLSTQNLPAGSARLLYTNHFDARGNKLAFSTPNGLVAPGGEWHVEKPLTAFQNQVQLKKEFGQHSLSVGGYFANYTQTNRWFFTDILMDVRDNPRFLDVVVVNNNVTTEITKNGFRNFTSFYVNGSGQTTVASAMVGGALQLSPRLRADFGARYEFNDYVQSVEDRQSFDLDGSASTKYDNVTWGSGKFRHFKLDISDWAGSLGLNYLVNERVSLYGQASRAYKMPALDEFLFGEAQDKVELFDARETRIAEAGVKYAARQVSFTVNGFYALLKNITGQGAVTDANGNVTWILNTAPENLSYGVELEAAASMYGGLSVLASGTFLKAELGTGAGADIGSWLNGVPELIGNLSATYQVGGTTLLGDWHYVGSRFSDVQNGNELPAYAYANFGVSHRLRAQGVTVSLDLLNAFQSKGLEEGNPRLSQVGGRTSDLFLARPILPRRLMAGVRYDF